MNYQLIPFPLNFNGVRYSPQVIVTMARPTFKGYMDNIQLKTGKTLDDCWRLANEKSLVERGKVVSKHSEMLAWLKSQEIGRDTSMQTSSYYTSDCVQMTQNLVPNPRNGLIAPVTRNDQ